MHDVGLLLKELAVASLVYIYDSKIYRNWF